MCFKRFFTIFSLFFAWVMLIQVVYAQNKLYVTPDSNNSNIISNEDKPTNRSKIYIAPGQQRIPRTFDLNKANSNTKRPRVTVAKPNVRIFDQAQNQIDSVVFKKSLEAYSDFSDLDVLKMYSFGDLPENNDELLKVANAHKLPRVLAMMDLQKELNKPASQQDIVVKAPVGREKKSLGANNDSDRINHSSKNNRAIYVQPNSQKKPRTWKLWGNSR